MKFECHKCLEIKEENEFQSPSSLDYQEFFYLDIETGIESLSFYPMCLDCYAKWVEDIAEALAAPLRQSVFAGDIVNDIFEIIEVKTPPDNTRNN